jgi:hypothetical protein
MKVAIMQPYFLPYLGYFQLAAAVDAFVVYDDIKYTKSGWINRNRILVNGAPSVVSLPLAADSDARDIRERQLAADFPAHAAKLRRRIVAAYQGAPGWQAGWPLVDHCLGQSDLNLFNFLLGSLRLVFAHLGIRSRLIVSSTLGVDRSLRGAERVLATCAALGAECYLNPPGGRHLYQRDAFASAGIKLFFLEPALAPYPQYKSSVPFVSHLSILDVLMNHPPGQVEKLLSGYTLAET